MEKIEKKFMSPNEMSEKGLVWYINKYALHPLGLAMARDCDENTITGCAIAPDGKWEFSEESNTKNKIKFKNFLKEFKKEHLYEKINFTREDLDKLDEIQNKILGECDGSRSVGYKSDQQIFELCLEINKKLIKEGMTNYVNISPSLVLDQFDFLDKFINKYFTNYFDNKI